MAVPASPVDAELHAPARNHSEQLVVESCTVSRWRGYVSSTFVAMLEDGTFIAESPAFRLRGKAEPADEGPVRKAYDELQAELGRLGWEAADTQREVWYAGRFTRLVAVPVATAPAPPVLEAPAVVEPQRRPLHEAPARPPVPPRVAPPVEAEPLPVEEAPVPTPVPPPTAHTAVEAPRRSRVVTVVSVLGIVVALAIAAYLAFGQASHHVAQAAQVSTAKPKNAAAAPASAASVPAPSLARPTVRVTISTHRRSSWLEVRRGSATGPVLFTGELAPGRTLHLVGTRLWSRFGAAGNLTITANGRPVRLVGTYEHVFTAAKP